MINDLKTKRKILYIQQNQFNLFFIYENLYLINILINYRIATANCFHGMDFSNRDKQFKYTLLTHYYLYTKLSFICVYYYFYRLFCFFFYYQYTF